MPLIYHVRHGRAAASFTDDLDPGLDELGTQQAIAACEILKNNLPLEILSSPLKRARETAQPLLDFTNQSMTIDDRVAEIPSPGLSLEQRGEWLRGVMSGRWSEQSAELQEWRRSLGECLIEVKTDTVIFSHFVAINAAVGIAENDDQVMLFRPNNGSITIFETDGTSLKLIARGDEATTKVN